MPLKFETMAKVQDIVMRFRYDVFKLITFNVSDRNQILNDIFRGLEWVKEVLPEDAEEIAERNKPKAKPVLNRRPKKTTHTVSNEKLLNLKDFVGNKELGVYRKRKRKQ